MGWYVEEGVVSDGEIVAVDGFVLDLFFSGAHQIADSGLGVLGPVGLDVGDFHCHQFSVEAVEEGHQEELFAFHPEVAVCEVESPGVGSALPEHEEIFSAGDEAESDQSSHEDEGLPPGHTEVFVVRADLFGTSEVAVGANGVGDTEEYGFGGLVEGVNVGSLGGSFEALSLLSSFAYFLFEGLYIGSVSLGEDAESALGNFG